MGQRKGWNSLAGRTLPTPAVACKLCWYASRTAELVLNLHFHLLISIQQCPINKFRTVTMSQAARCLTF